MKMLKPTDVVGLTIYLNPAHIVSFCRTNGSGRTIVAMDDKSTWHVKESPEEIMAMLANLREGE